MKKIKSYYLSKSVIDAVKLKAEADDRSDSEWLNRYLSNLSETKKALNKEVKFDFKKALVLAGVDKSTVSQWLQVRKNKKATNTEIAFNAIISEITKSGLNPQQAIAESVKNSWSGFKASWVNKVKAGKTSGNKQAIEDFING